MTNKSIRIAFGLVIATCFLLWTFWESISPTEPWLQPSRAIGDPLTGYWALETYGACYDNAAVYRFDEDRITIFKFPEVKTYPQTDINITQNGRIRVDFPMVPDQQGVTSAVIYRDLGDRLKLETEIIDGNEMPVQGADDLVNCGHHSFGDRLGLAFDRAFHVEDFGDHAPPQR